MADDNAQELDGEEISGEVVLYAEEVDAEVVPDFTDIRWLQWYNQDKATTVFKMEVDQSWYHRVDRADWEQLNALLGGIADLVRRTSTRGPRTATAAERAAEGCGDPRNTR